jgi:hypothetical protein
MIKTKDNPPHKTFASFPSAQNPRFAGKMVFVIRRQQAIMPNHCSQSNTFLYYTFMVLLSLQCPSGCYRRFVMLLAVPPHSSRQLLCPSRHLVHSFLRYASSHLVRTCAFCFMAWSALQTTDQRTCSHIPFRKANATILTGFHFASLRHPFTSVAFSPPAANNFARRLSPLRLRSLNCCADSQTLTHGSFVPHFAMQH